MKKQFALTQVCVVDLTRAEIEAILRDNLKERGGDPSYDFASNHPIFIWGDNGDVSVRYVQGAVFAREREQFIRLQPVPTSAEINKIMRERIAKAEAK